MRCWRLIGSALLCCQLLSACAETADAGPERYIVRPQDTLYSIAWRHNLDYRDVARWNNIGRDFHISVGQVLVLGPTGTPAPATVPRAGAPRPLAQAMPGTGSTGLWVWPTERAGAPRPVPGGGILLSGRLGQDVRAASAGRVVYSGNGLRGYGNLIIIKHADNLLSAYAHNREMLVHDGAEVVAGQVIAHMGESAQQLPVLYFELRQNGKPIDPLLVLPK